MDWSRVKSILIIALLITNSIIILFIVFDNDSTNLTDVENQRQLLNEILLEKNINNQIGDDVAQSEAMPQLMMARQLYDMDALADALLGEHSKEDGVYYGADYQMSFNKNILSIKSRNVADSAATSNQSAEHIAEDFIKRYFENANDYRLVSNVSKAGSVFLNYTQVYQNYTIYNTSMLIVVADEHVVSLQREWMTVNAKDDAQQPIKAYHHALLSAIDQFSELAPITITAVDLGYRLENTLLGEDVQSGDALPYYRFSLSDGQQIFVPALLQNISVNRPIQ